jgi:hypothetical protein
MTIDLLTKSRVPTSNRVLSCKSPRSAYALASRTTLLFDLSGRLCEGPP